MNNQEICTLAHQIRKNTGCDLKEAFRQAYAQANTVAPKTSFNRADLDNIFSDKLSKLLSKGYIINTSTMAGHQGEIAKIHLQKDGKLFILLMDKEHNFRNKYDTTVCIRFGEYSQDANLRYDSVWNNKFNFSWEVKFVALSEDFYVTEEVAAKANEKAYLRMTKRYETATKEINPAAAEILLKYARKQQGCKTAKLSDIQKIRRMANGWHFECRGKRMSLHF